MKRDIGRWRWIINVRSTTTLRALNDLKLAISDNGSWLQSRTDIGWPNLRVVLSSEIYVALFLKRAPVIRWSDQMSNNRNQMERIGEARNVVKKIQFSIPIKEIVDCHLELIFARFPMTSSE